MRVQGPEKILRCESELGEFVPNIGLMLRERRSLFGDRAAYLEKAAAPGAITRQVPRGEGDYRILTWEELYGDAARIGSSLIGLGIGTGDVLACYSRNRREMLLWELAAMSVGAAVCPIFSEYPVPQLDYLLEHAEAKMLAVSDPEHLKAVLKTKAAKRLKRIFLMDFPRDGAKARQSQVLPFDSLLATGESGHLSEFERRSSEVLPDQACLLMYTSGTTGRPKGVLLSHKNILSQRKAIGRLWNLGPEDRFLSYLPWHHSFGGIFELFGALYNGAFLTLDESYGRNIPLLIENFKRVKPTVYFSVPSIYQALVAEARTSKRLEDEIFHPGLKFVFTAAAPLPGPVAEYFKAKGIPVVEGWGLTETSPCVTMTSLSGERTAGVVGMPIPGDEVRLTSDGEILVRGPNVMLGYHKDPELTARVLGPDGWFHTGDFGEITDKGLALKCRIDGMFKLTTGQMVISQDVENALADSPLIRFAVAFGGGQDFVGAIVFPDPAALEQAALKAATPRRDLLRSEVERVSKSIPEKYARPKAFIVAGSEPSLSNGELTPTMKIVKSKVMKNHAAQIKALYDPRRAPPKLRKEVIEV